MGVSASFFQRFQSKYTFIEYTDDRNFGLVKIYRKVELNYDYVMILNRTVCQDTLSRFQNELALIHKELLRQSEPPILRIFHSQTLEPIGGCQQPSVRIYMEYLNFTLQDMLTLHAQNGDSFTTEEIMYILSSVILIFAFFKSIDANYMTLKPDCIFLSPQGYIRFCPIRIERESPPLDEPCQLSCIGVAESVHFQSSERQIMLDLRKLMADIIALTKKGDQSYSQHLKLLFKVNSSRTIQHLKQYLGPAAECLAFTRKTIDSSEHSTNQEKESHLIISKANQSFKRLSAMNEPLRPEYRQMPQNGPIKPFEWGARNEYPVLADRYN